ncbi:hypothetical protein QNI19_16460 [Cytophagaceae bacterium DM2B3-1]|uniref:Uncharacterized protein n=1 Tax=Xanthocytophaga flava TaxID=3048013 RepID=A0ABT7CLB9_9BACT|nr:hypothetical protein [Xanthocytophaga flavus]MDJ1494539.1 hypothetical protein [Xanthocytophaga flavus]
MFWSLFTAGAGKAGGSLLSSKPFQIFLIVIIVVVVIWYVGRKMGLEEAAKEKPLPNSGSGIPQVKNPDGTTSSWSPKALADEIYSKLNGITTSGISKMNTLNKIMVLTDDQCTALYNYFNKQYGKGETLTQWIEGEWFMSAKDKIVTRLKSLGLD